MKSLIALIIICVFSACQYDPHAHTYTTYKPSVDEVTGSYELDQIYMESYAPGIRDKITALAIKPIIQIHSDGRFSAVNFPYFEETRPGFEYRFSDFRSIDSKWEITTVGSIGYGSGATKDHYGIALAGMPLHLGSLGFTGTKKVNGLILGFGDPDSGDAIIYKKK